MPYFKKEEPSSSCEPSGRDSTALARFLSLPVGAMPGAVNLQLSGREELLLEGCNGIIRYEPDQIVLSTRRFMVKITGQQLQLRCLTVDSALVQGQINAITFE